MADLDTRPAIITFVERCHRDLRQAEGVRSLASVRDSGVPAERRPPARGGENRARMAVAAERALTVYPGPVGELIRREIAAYLDFGHRFDGSGLAPRLADHVLAAHPDTRAEMSGTHLVEASAR